MTDRGRSRIPGSGGAGTADSTVVVGIDLAGSEHRRTGFCELRGVRRVHTAVLGDDAEVVQRTLASQPRLVAIDAPLSLPWGRKDIEDRSGPHFRECDRELRRLGVPFFPITLGPMRMLTTRGIRVRRALEQRGLRVFESYPGGVQDLLGWPRKNAGVERLRRAMRSAGFVGDVERRAITHDELDAIACAHAARLFLDGLGRLIGDPQEGQILLPGPQPSPGQPATRVSGIRGR